MAYLDDKIKEFLDVHSFWREPLRKIIEESLDKCRYINKESLQRHNWSNEIIKLEEDFESVKEIKDDEERDCKINDILKKISSSGGDESVIELLWGDIQLGKREQACFIMWFSIHVLQRSVLYIFRNLNIDEQQLKNDIIGTGCNDFNTKYIDKIFEQYIKENKITRKHTEFRLKPMVSITKAENVQQVLNSDNISINCCLMNPSQLRKINNSFNNYIMNNNELARFTLLVDESDLFCSTSSNDASGEKDIIETSDNEKLLAKIYKKVKYVLHITGTAHSLLFNCRTSLNEDNDIILKISRVHKMKRHNTYYGLFNDNIKFNTDIVKPWWKAKKYNIIEDYNYNIKPIIDIIISRRTNYNSLLLSEETVRNKHFILATEIIKDFSKLFIIVFHGGRLRLYFPLEYEEILIQCTIKGKELNENGGIIGKPLVVDNYGYYDINTKRTKKCSNIFNIKMVYRVLSILFNDYIGNILHNSVITITGIYGDRGYSFTSSDYQKYQMHLTDQYFVSHGSFNCTNISQKLRLQGKYTDTLLENKETELTFWTTNDLKELMVGEYGYVNFIKKIEENIMSCKSWEEIITNIEKIKQIADFKEPIENLDVGKKMKSIEIKNKYEYDKNHSGFEVINTNEHKMNRMQMKEYCKENDLPDFYCINKIIHMEKDDYIKEYGIYEPQIPHRINIDIDITNKKTTLEYIKKFYPDCTKWAVYKVVPGAKNQDRFSGIERAIESKEPYNFANRCDKGEALIIKYSDKNIYHLVGLTFNKILPNNTKKCDKQPYWENDGRIYFTKIKEKYKDYEKYSYYYYLTPDGWLVLVEYTEEGKKIKDKYSHLTVLKPTS
jgi:hypothetical protein